MKFAETAILSTQTPLLPQRQTDGVTGKQADITDKIHEKAKEFESVFIAESLKHAKIGMPKDPEIGGSLITDTFDSFMNRALADNIMDQGGFGLAKHISDSLLSNYKIPQ